MTEFVLDCSVSAAWCLQDEHSPAAQRLLERMTEGKEALVPELWISEMGTVLAVAERRDRIDRADVDTALRLLRELPVRIIASENTTLADVVELARETGLSAYDATYLELARRLRAPLATFDARLRASARDLEVDVLNA